MGRDPGLKPIYQANESFCKVSDYRQYHLVERTKKNVSKNIAKYSRHMSENIRSRTFNAAGSITSLTFLTKLAVACDQEKISEGNYRWLFQ